MGFMFKTIEVGRDGDKVLVLVHVEPNVINLVLRRALTVLGTCELVVEHQASWRFLFIIYGWVH